MQSWDKFGQKGDEPQRPHVLEKEVLRLESERRKQAVLRRARANGFAEYRARLAENKKLVAEMLASIEKQR